MECGFCLFGFVIHEFESVHVKFQMYVRCWCCIRSFIVLLF